MRLRPKSSFYWHRTNAFHLKVTSLAHCNFEALAKTLTPYSRLEEMGLKMWRRQLTGEQIKHSLWTAKGRRIYWGRRKGNKDERVLQFERRNAHTILLKSQLLLHVSVPSGPQSRSTQLHKTVDSNLSACSCSILSAMSYTGWSKSLCSPDYCIHQVHRDV